MIGRANTGGGITLHVIGGLTKPSGAGENTIWLNTDVTITNWCIQNAAPENPEVGDVYITTRTATDNVLNISHPHDVSLYLGTARQWQTVEGVDQWVDLSGEVYYGSAWHNIQTFVYNGDLNAGADNFNSKVGGKTWTQQNGTITLGDDHFYYSTGPNATSYYYSQYKIDFTNVKTVKFIYARTSGGGGRTARFVVFPESPGTASASITPPTTASDAKEPITIDTESLSGMYYLGYYESSGSSSASGKLWVYSIELIS